MVDSLATPISYAKCNLLYLGRQEANGALLTINGIPPATSSFTERTWCCY